MADVKLLKYDGTEQQYRGVERVQLAKVDGGTAIFSEGEAVEGIEISPDFSSGDMPVIAPAGTLVKSAVIVKPEELIPGNIRRGVTVAGIQGDLVGDTEERTVELSMADGDQIILPTQDGKVISQVTVTKPETLVPDNILAGVEIGGVTGTLDPPDPVETEVTLDFSEGDMEVVPDAGKLFSKVSIPVPENLIPENIAKDVEIAGITGTHEGGGGSAELRYVTFKDDTGTVEYGKKAVATGDDCADPIARGVFDTPTKASTAQYTYTFSGGWATTPNGGIDSNALKAVEEDRTVYANFIATVRSYTITFYDSDGTTVLNTKSVAYGSVPSYTPTKEGVAFVGWDKELEAVTGDASYIALWTEKLTFANALWSDIARVSEAGQASQHFAVGDTRKIPVTWDNGTTKDVEFEIIGIDHDDMADGSGKAGITLGTKNALSIPYFVGGLVTFASGWKQSAVRSTLNSDGFNQISAEVSRYIKTVKKKSLRAYGSYYTDTTEDKLFIPSPSEYFGDAGYGTQYTRFTNAENRKKYDEYPNNIGTSYISHGTRNAGGNSSNMMVYVDASGKKAANAAPNFFCICFCI